MSQIKVKNKSMFTDNKKKTNKLSKINSSIN